MKLESDLIPSESTARVVESAHKPFDSDSSISGISDPDSSNPLTASESDSLIPTTRPYYL